MNLTPCLQGFKRHKRNGVVFCFFGSRVFATCMDEECATTLKRRRQPYFIMAKELEDIHLGAYDEFISTKKEDFFEQGIMQKSKFAAKLTAEADRKLLKSEAEKRWTRVMMQGGTDVVDWAGQQLDRVRQGKVVFATPEADAASRNCDLVMYIPSMMIG